nr:NAD(P)H-binding protein [Proteiniclasticum ruminis]
MKIFLLGATGQTGSIFMKMALERNHKVTAYVRSPEKVLLHNENLTIVKGAVFSLVDMASHDVVVSCLGGNNNDKETVITKMTEIIIKSMKANEINRIVTISTAAYTMSSRLS